MIVYCLVKYVLPICCGVVKHDQFSDSILSIYYRFLVLLNPQQTDLILRFCCQPFLHLFNFRINVMHIVYINRNCRLIWNTVSCPRKRPLSVEVCRKCAISTWRNFIHLVCDSFFQFCVILVRFRCQLQNQRDFPLWKFGNFRCLATGWGALIKSKFQLDGAFSHLKLLM